MRLNHRIQASLLLAVALVFIIPPPDTDAQVYRCPTQVFFAPGPDCTNQAVKYIDGAKSEVLVMAYSFTQTKIADALIHANFRQGVTVEYLFDKSNLTLGTSVVKRLKDSGVAGLLDKKENIMHDKVIIIDKKIVITGSFNWAIGAEHNAENCLVIQCYTMAERYRQNYLEHKAHSEEY